MIDPVRVSAFNSLNSTSGTRVTSGTNNSAATSATDQAKKEAQDLQDRFLKILLTQLQNQNPTDPMDTKEFTGQLAQFSSLEQQISTNSKLDALAESMKSNAATNAFGYIGQTAEVSTNMTVMENDTADWRYALNSNAQNLNIKIKDSTGRVVYEKNERNALSGTYDLKAKLSDLTNVKNGDTLRLEITAKDQAGRDVRTEISTTMRVDGVEIGQNGIDLRSGGLIYSLADVRKFTSTPATPAPSTPPSSTTPST